MPVITAAWKIKLENLQLVAKTELHGEFQTNLGYCLKRERMGRR